MKRVSSFDSLFPTMEGRVRAPAPEPDITANRHGGNPESVAAHEQAATHSGRDRDRIVEYIRGQPDGATVDEICVALEMPLTTVSARVSELLWKYERLVRTEKRRKTRTGAMASVLVIA